MKKVAFLLVLFAVGVQVANSFSSVSITPDEAVLGFSNEGQVFLNLNNSEVGQDIAVRFGDSLMCGEDFTTTKEDEWLLVYSGGIYPDGVVFPVCAWPKGEYQNKSCATITYIEEHDNYESPDDWPTDEWLGYITPDTRCVARQGVYIPMIVVE